MSVPNANFDLEGKNLSLIDFCSEDDCLYVSPPRDHPTLRIPDDQKEQKDVQYLAVQESKDSIDGDEQAIQPVESSDGKKTKRNGKYNLRKSLAWDKAFFTSAGVLEPEELSTMISGVDQGQKRFALPEIEEEICRSSESICTLATDKSTVGTLEDDLFGDIRASIQKSSKACQDIQTARKNEEKLALTGIDEDLRRSNDSISTLATDISASGTLEDDLFGDIRASIQKSSKASRPMSQGKLASGVNASQLIKYSEKVSTVSQNKLMTKVALKKPSVITKGSGKLVNKVSPSPEAPKCGSRTGESVSSLSKPPKIIARANSFSAVPTKRASSSANNIKVEKDNAKTLTVPGRETKVPANGALRCGVPKPLARVKSSLGSSVTSKPQLTPSSSIDSFESLSSSSSKHSSESQKQKLDSETSNNSSITTTVRTGSTTTRTAARNRNLPMSSHISPRVNSLTKLSSSISPASSISEWSSQSLSPTSTLNNRSSISRPSIDTSSWKNVSSKADAFQASGSENSVGNNTQVTGLLNKSSKAVSNGSVALNHPKAIKPSGLRMPSPKIGFFDGAKSMVRTPTGSLKSPTESCNLPKSGSGNVSPGGGVKEARREKLRPARTIMAIRGTKAGAQKTALETKLKSPLPLQEASNPSPKVLSGSRSGKNHPGMPLKVQNKKSPGKDEQYSLNAEKIATKESETAVSNSDLCDSETSNSPCKDTICLDVKDNNSGKVEEKQTVDGGSIATGNVSSTTEKVGEFCSHNTDLKPVTEVEPKSPSPLQEASNLSPKVCSGSRTRKHSPVMPLKVQNKKSPGKNEPCNLNFENIAATKSNAAIGNPVCCDPEVNNNLCKDKLSSYGEGNDSEKVEDSFIVSGGSSATRIASFEIVDEGEHCSHKNDIIPTSEIKMKSPLPLQEASNLSPKVLSCLKTGKHKPGKLLEFQNEKSPGKEEWCYLISENVATKESNTAISNTETCNSESNSLGKDKMSSHGESSDSRKGKEIPTAREASASCNSSSTLVEEGESCSQKNDLSSFNSSKKEKTCFQDEVDSVAQQLEALYILGEIQQKAADNCCSFDQVNISGEAQPGARAETVNLSKPTPSHIPIEGVKMVDTEES